MNQQTYQLLHISKHNNHLLNKELIPWYLRFLFFSAVICGHYSRQFKVKNVSIPGALRIGLASKHVKIWRRLSKEQPRENSARESCLIIRKGRGIFIYKQKIAKNVCTRHKLPTIINPSCLIISGAISGPFLFIGGLGSHHRENDNWRLPIKVIKFLKIWPHFGTLWLAHYSRDLSSLHHQVVGGV